MTTQFDPEAVAHGRSIAAQLSQYHEAGETGKLVKYREDLGAEGRAALEMYRDYQMATLISEVEESHAGARIRFEEAQAAYRALVAKEFQQIIEGAVQ